MTTVRFGSVPSSFAAIRNVSGAGFPAKVLRVNRVAIDQHVEGIFQLGGFQNGFAVLAGGDDGDLEALTSELMNELDASLIGFNPPVLDDRVDQVVLAVPEPAHCLGLRGIVRASLGKPNTARREKVANTVEARLAIHIEPVVRSKIEGTKRFAAPARALLKVLVEHLFPTERVDAGSVGYHAVEVKKDGIVPVVGDRTPALRAASASACSRRARVDERSVPDTHRGHVAVVAEDAQGARVQQEMLTAARG